ncbi:MAG: cation transporter [Pseudomonadota bacterium]
MSKNEIEIRALKLNKWANLFMAFAGIVAALLSHSDAILVDGLYSAVNVISAIIAIRVAKRVNQPPDRSRPWGYAFEESIYVTFRSLVLLGILLFAALASANKIFTYLTGGSVPELVFGPILIYAVGMVIICLGLALYHRRAYAKSGKTSTILRAEAKAALVDAAISAGTGIALMSLPILQDTPLAPIVPIGDAIVVLIMVVVIIWQPLGLFRSALAELAGASAPAAVHLAISRRAKELAGEHGYRFLRAAVQQAGRTRFAVIYVNPKKPVNAQQVDKFWRLLNQQLSEDGGLVRCEVVITEIPEVDAS